MDMGFHTWLVIIGGVVLVAIFLDGLRRMLASRNSLKFDLNKNIPEGDAEDNTEVLGPPRVVSRKTEPEISTLDTHSVELAPENMREPQDAYTEGFSATRDDEFTLETQDLITSNEMQVTDSLTAFDLDTQTRPNEVEDFPESNADNAQNIDALMILVFARSPLGFKGNDLLECILSKGLRFGEMDIFHRYENITGHGDTLFSMANAFNPGTFDINNMNDFSTTGVSFFMQLPGPKNPSETFEFMLESAKFLAKQLNGDLKDDQGSVLTSQTIEHYRERIAEFEYRQRQRHG